MKNILLSKQPQIVANVLNGKAKILVCKKFPKDYVGWVYVYCTKREPYIYKEYTEKELLNEDIKWLNGKVVARFWCDKVEKYYNAGQWVGEELNDIMNIICDNACISRDDLDDYCEGKHFYTINISKLEIFDKPKELSEFTYEQPFKVRDSGLFEVIEKDLEVLEQLEILKEYYEPFKTFLNDMFEKGHNTDLNKIKEWLEK